MYQSGIGFRQTDTPVMAISVSETENSINTTSPVHTTADTHAFTTECTIVKIHKRLHCTGYHLSPYIHVTEGKNQQTQHISQYLSVNLCFSIQAIDAISSRLAVSSQNPHIVHKPPD